MNFGMPYQGSKNKVAKDIIEQLPPAEHFYDLFGGGGAITHCAVLSGKYKYVHYNEINPLVTKGFEMAINGEFNNENRWISREEFYQLKDTNPYVAICFSFGNNLVDYLYGKDVEPIKKALYYSRVFSDDSLIEEQGRLVTLERLKRLRQLQSLDSVKRLRQLQITNVSYDKVPLQSDYVIYCDIPYKNTKKYCHNEFDYDKFYEWCKGKKNLFVSEYSMPPEFIEVWSKKHKSFMSATKPVDSVEKLFTLKE